MNRTPKIVFLIPTRNRAELALRALRAALAGGGEAVQLVVSDNSTDPAHVAQLQEAVRSMGPRVTYIRPATSMEMTTHWNWAFGEAIRLHAPTHLGVLTDRMVLCSGRAIDRLVTLVGENFDDAITYNIDTFNDIQRPYWLRRKRGSGALEAVSTREFAERSADGNVEYSLPRLLNCVVPVAQMQKVHEAFGDFCVSISPDYAFAYRYLCVHERCLVWDYAPLVQYTLQRSNGLSIGRGKYESPDAKDFIRNTGGALRFRHTPLPEILTINNACLDEYEAVRAHPAGRALPAIRMPGYVRILCRDVALVEVPEVRNAFIRALEQHGFAREWRRHGRSRLWRHAARRWASRHFRPLMVLWLKFVKRRRFYDSIDEVLAELATAPERALR
jgi:hypothetical protein